LFGPFILFMLYFYFSPGCTLPVSPSQFTTPCCRLIWSQSSGLFGILVTGRWVFSVIQHRSQARAEVMTRCSICPCGNTRNSQRCAHFRIRTEVWCSVMYALVMERSEYMYHWLHFTYFYTLCFTV
jgi:hypothetical protein